MSEPTRKLLFSYEVVEQELARCRAEMREQIAKEIEHELESNASYFGLAKQGEKWYGYQDALRLGAKIARGK